MPKKFYKPKDQEKHKGIGHRKRLRDRFLQGGLDSFLDYEIVELLLTLGTPRKDCKQMAKEAIKKFKSLRGVLEAPLEELLEIKGIGPHNAFGIKFVQEVARKFLKEKTLKRPICKSSKEIFDYLYHSMRDLDYEVFKAIMLNAQNEIIDIIDIFKGTLTSSAIYPREVIKQALKYPATAIVFVHNHPSGEPKPSKEDKKITRDLVFAANLMDIKVFDHIIIGDNCYYSFANNNLLKQYNQDYKNK